MELHLRDLENFISAVWLPHPRGIQVGHQGENSRTPFVWWTATFFAACREPGAE
jgi:hypothetical protein